MSQEHYYICDCCKIKVEAKQGEFHFYDSPRGWKVFNKEDFCKECYKKLKECAKRK